MNLPASAHHSYAVYEHVRTVTLQGTVKAFQWSNPHIEIVMWVKSDVSGDPESWSIETSSPGILTRFGWTPSSIRVGDRVSVLVNPQIDGTRSGRLHTVTVLGSGARLETKLSALDEKPPQ